MNELCLQQGTKEWLDLRRTKVTATDSSIILGLSPYCSPHLLWKRKLGLEPDQEVNRAMEIGSALEPEARGAFIQETGIFVEPKVIIKEFQMASMDGVSPCGKYAVEIKCSSKILNNLKNDVLDTCHNAQMQHQMSVLDIGSMYFFAYWDGEFEIDEVYRDDAFIEKMLEKEKAFFLSLQNFEAPELSEKDYRFIDDEKFEFESKQYLYFKEQEKFFKDGAEKFKESLIKRADGQCSIGKTCKMIRYKVKGRIDYDKIINDFKINEEEFRKPDTQAWRITGIN